VHLVSSWAEAYMKAQPGMQVSVTGGGSGTGIAALMNGTTDIAAASRDLSANEKTMAGQKKLGLAETVVGMDGLSVVVNPENPVKALTMGQLKAVFTGEVTNWKALGGPDVPVLVYSRESSSGTYAFFQEHVLEKQDYAKSARLMPATSSIIEAVSSDKGGIGYVGLGYAEEAAAKIRIVPVKKDAQSPAVMPSKATVNDKTYPIARALYLIAPAGAPPSAQAFLKYATSKEGQHIVQEAGYIALPES